MIVSIWCHAGKFNTLQPISKWDGVNGSSVQTNDSGQEFKTISTTATAEVIFYNVMLHKFPIVFFKHLFTDLTIL